MSTRAHVLTHRPARSTPAIILAFLAIIIGGVLVWVIGGRLLDGSWPESIAERMHQIGALRLDSTPVLITAGVLAVLGLVFLISALIPGDAGRRAILAGEVPGQTAVSRRDIARRVERRVERVDGVADVRARLSGRTLSVHVRTPVDETDPVLRRSRDAVQETIDELAPIIDIRPRVQLSRTR